VQLADGERVPALGQGTWGMGENKNTHASEVAALRLGIDLGMSLIDTAEMYGEGESEKVVADVIDDQRDRVLSSRKCTRTTLPARNCRKHASAVSSGLASIRSIFICCIGVATGRSRKPWKHSSNFEQLERFGAGVFQTSMSKA